MLKKLFIPFLAISLLSACGDSDGGNDNDLETIAEIVAGNENFETLAAAVEAADLTDTLGGDGPFTVFAPTDEAFEALPEGLLEQLLDDPEALSDILLYHVVADELLAEDVLAESSLTTVQGDDISVDGEEGTLNGTVAITQTDILASNGVIHVIDAVLIPPTEPEAQSIVEIAVGNPDFSTLVAAVQAAGLVDALEGEGPFTVFAPTNEAFAALPDGVLDDLLGDPEALAQVLLYHVVPGDLRAAEVLSSSSLTTLQEGQVSVDGSSATLNGNSGIVATDIVASNGVIHVIDAVLIPETN
jgi:transforming growth factor-beta-induced protein